MSLNALLDSNIAELQTAAALVSELSDTQYCQLPDERLFTASIGAHLRHVIEHYQLFLQGLTAAEVDYDQRQRDSRFEQDRDYAKAAIMSIIQSLQDSKTDHHTAALHPAMSVKICTRDDGHPESAVHSSMQRELIFLQGHTTHHYAMIAIMLRSMGLNMDERFGLAASTAAYRAQQSDSSEPKIGTAAGQ